MANLWHFNNAVLPSGDSVNQSHPLKKLGRLACLLAAERKTLSLPFS